MSVDNSTQSGEWQWAASVSTSAPNKAVLMELARNSHNWTCRLTAADVARGLNLEGRTVQYAFTRLEREGLIVRRRRGLLYLKGSVREGPRHKRTPPARYALPMKGRLPGDVVAVTVPMAAKALSVSSGLVYKLVKTGQLRHIRLGDRIAIPWQALKDLTEGDSRKLPQA